MDTTYNWRGKVTKKPLPCQRPFVGGLPAPYADINVVDLHPRISISFSSFSPPSSSRGFSSPLRYLVFYSPEQRVGAPFHAYHKKFPLSIKSRRSAITRPCRKRAPIQQITAHNYATVTVSVHWFGFSNDLSFFSREANSIFVRLPSPRRSFYRGTVARLTPLRLPLSPPLSQLSTPSIPPPPPQKANHPSTFLSSSLFLISFSCHLPSQR